jgi:uncharacterized membrane protein
MKRAESYLLAALIITVPVGGYFFVRGLFTSPELRAAVWSVQTAKDVGAVLGVVGVLALFFLGLNWFDRRR